MSDLSFCYSERATTSRELHHMSCPRSSSRGNTRVLDGSECALQLWGASDMRIKIQDGTPISGESSLCSTCRCSTIVRGRTLDEELVLCSALGLHGVQITFKVTSCSDYADRRTPSYMEMMQDAWILQPGTRRRRAGFVRGSDLQEEDLLPLRSNLGRKRGK